MCQRSEGFGQLALGQTVPCAALYPRNATTSAPEPVTRRIGCISPMAGLRGLQAITQPNGNDLRHGLLCMEAMRRRGAVRAWVVFDMDAVS